MTHPGQTRARGGSRIDRKSLLGISEPGCVFTVRSTDGYDISHSFIAIIQTALPALTALRHRNLNLDTGKPM